jgi:uncharacterized protein
MSNPKSNRGKCPVCKGAIATEHAPFCSQGCKDRDLLQWLGEGYRVAGPPAEYEDISSSGEGD